MSDVLHVHVFTEIYSETYIHHHKIHKKNSDLIVLWVCLATI